MIAKFWMFLIKFEAFEIRGFHQRTKIELENLDQYTFYSLVVISESDKQNVLQWHKSSFMQTLCYSNLYAGSRIK